MKVKQFYNKNQFVIEEKGKTIFQSYDSTIAIYEKGLLTLGNDWNYSTTTSKHLYLFINDYVNNPKIKEVNNKTNKRDYINNLIKNDIVKYNIDLI